MIVVDCSAVVDALSGVEGADKLRTRLAAEELHAPTLLDVEIASVLRGLTLGGGLSLARAQEVLDDFADLPVQRWTFADGFRRRALQLRNNVSCYDATYVSLAEALECPLVTRDGRLARSSGHDAVIEVC